MLTPILLLSFTAFSMNFKERRILSDSLLSQLESISQNMKNDQWKDSTLVTGALTITMKDNVNESEEDTIPSPLTRSTRSSSSFVEDDSVESVSSNIRRLRAKQKLLRLQSASTLAESRRRLSQNSPNRDAMSVTSQTTLSSSAHPTASIPQHVLISQSQPWLEQRLLDVREELAVTKRMMRGMFVLLFLLLATVGLWEYKEQPFLSRFLTFHSKTQEEEIPNVTVAPNARKTTMDPTEPELLLIQQYCSTFVSTSTTLDTTIPTPHLALHKDPDRLNDMESEDLSMWKATIHDPHAERRPSTVVLPPAQSIFDTIQDDDIALWLSQ
jgi:hypothetical protein